jgi:hypothetical protein
VSLEDIFNYRWNGKRGIFRVKPRVLLGKNVSRTLLLTKALECEALDKG